MVNPPHDWDSGEDAFPPHDAPLVEDRRTEARICAVQLVAQALLLNQPVAAGLEGFLPHLNRRKADKKLFNLLAAEAAEGEARYTQMIQAQLNATWPWARMNGVLRAILWVAAAELTVAPTLGTGVILNEYMNIAKGFLPEDEVAFTRATLEKLVLAIRGS